MVQQWQSDLEPGWRGETRSRRTLRRARCGRGRRTARSARDGAMLVCEPRAGGGGPGRGAGGGPGGAGRRGAAER
ncbi:hypothetical protein QJS66_16855 [Kocuria rhizophila]|nr:hypothetical protein QJS66_16855 [Kocuria rhizophila]